MRWLQFLFNARMRLSIVRRRLSGVLFLGANINSLTVDIEKSYLS